MSDPMLGLAMLGLIVAAIMMGFPTAFTLMGLGMLFGYLAFWKPGSGHWLDNQVFDLFVQRTFGGMNNETLLSIPLFVLMGYIIERAALVDRMFFSVQLAFRRLPASLAVTTLLICAFWGIASGIVGAVVVLMGVIALRPMLKAGYDVRLASGVITAGGTLGILIPPSVMLIVYAAVAGQSIVKLYAAAMLPGFFLTLLYLVYIIGWALLNPKIAPKLPPDEYRTPVPEWMQGLERGPGRRVIGGLFAALFRPGSLAGARGLDGQSVTLGLLLKNAAAALVPLGLVASLFAAAWWYVLVYHTPAAPAAQSAVTLLAAHAAEPSPAAPAADKAPQPLISDQEATSEEPQGLVGSMLAEPGADDTLGKIPENFRAWFWTFAVLAAILLGIYYWRMDGEQFEILKLLEYSVVPLAVLTFIVLAVILFGITTASESAGIGALGALYLAAFSRQSRRTLRGSVVGAVIGLAFGSLRGDATTLLVSGVLGAVFGGTLFSFALDYLHERKLAAILKESTFLTAKTTAMVCWLFVGSALFSAVFALHGGQGLIEKWVLSLDLTPLQFLILSQAIIFLLGWPLEWTEIIVIFVPIFIPLLVHFNVDPVLFGALVAVNLQAAFLSPPVAMSAFYLKGVSPPHVTLNQIFAGMMPYMLIVIVCMIFMYLFPGMTLWLPSFLYGK
jgi:TRAP-type mannitol/chloroaromatic compound transport system permease large subunit